VISDLILIVFSSNPDSVEEFGHNSLFRHVRFKTTHLHHGAVVDLMGFADFEGIQENLLKICISCYAL
jgi:hypothetical protein